MPDELFEAVERLVRRSKRHRSDVYAAALREYVARREPDEVTDALNAVTEQTQGASTDDALIDAAARTVLKASEW